MAMEKIKVTDLAAIVDRLPEASEKDVVVDGKTEKGFKAICQGEQVLKIFTDKYALIQHRDAFAGVLDALLLAEKENVKAAVFQTPGRAYLTVVFPEIVVDDGAEGIELGFKVSNSHMGEALKFSGSSTKNTSEFKFFGYRLACSNGMILPVELEKMTVADMELTEKKGGIFQKEVRTQKILAKAGGRIVHIGDADAKVQLVYQKIMLMYRSVAVVKQYIDSMRNRQLTREEAIKSLEGVFGPRIGASVLSQFDMEEQTLFGLYNSVTYLASHSERSEPNKEMLMMAANTIAKKVLSNVDS